MPSEAKTHTEEGAALTELIMSVFSAHVRLVREGDILARDLGITSVRWRVLSLMARESLTVAQLARRFDSTRQSMLWVVTALVNDGLVVLTYNPDHKRAKLAGLTEKGQLVYKLMRGRQIDWANQVGAGFTSEELRAAAQVLDRLFCASESGSGPTDEVAVDAFERRIA